MNLADIPSLAERQLRIDRARTKRYPDLFERKLQRMSASSLAFLRGSAPLFYATLFALRPELGDGPGGSGWIVGDLHLENYGAYRPVRGEKKERAVFDLNDFDDTTIGPWRYDVVRLATSVLLAARGVGATGPVALELVDHVLDAWGRAVFDEDRPFSDPPRPVRQLLRQVQTRTHDALLGARTETKRGRARFVRGPRYADLPKPVLRAVPRAFETYLASLFTAEQPAGPFEIVDAAFRIAGTGSLGGLRIAVLVEGKGGASIFDLKEQGAPSSASLVAPPKLPAAERVVTGFRACVEKAPQAMGTTRLGRLSMSGRRLTPQEDKLDLRHLRGGELRALASYLGSLLGAAHARGALEVPRRWSKSDRALVRTNAVTLAGLHEGIYLALCDRMRDPRR